MSDGGNFVKTGADILTLLDTPNWCHSREGRPLRLVASHPLESLHALKPIVVIGGVHGDEPEGVVLASECLHWLMDDARKPQPESKNPWIVIPVLNPDGVFHQRRTNGAQVDLNRNYPSTNWSSEARAARYYPGPHPASEPEIQALVKLIHATRPKLLIHCHSWNPCIVATGQPSRIAAEALARSSGYSITDDIGYPTPGSLSEYGWHDERIPVICIEEQEHVDLKTVWPRFADGMKEIFRNAEVVAP
jgi:hypothetical protein